MGKYSIYSPCPITIKYGVTVKITMVAEGCHSEKNKQTTNKEKWHVFYKNSVYKKIINKLNLLKLLKKYFEAKLL